MDCKREEGIAYLYVEIVKRKKDIKSLIYIIYIIVHGLSLSFSNTQYIIIFTVLNKLVIKT